MNDQLDALRTSVVAAVQQELTRFSGEVSAEIQRLRDELAVERAARQRTDEQLGSLAGYAERRLTEFVNQSKRRQEDMEARVGRIADEANRGMVAAVEAAARPVFQRVEDRQARVEQEVAGLGRSVQKFDQQAAQMVQHLNVLSEATETRLEEVSRQASEHVDARLVAVVSRLDEVSAQAARQQAETTNMVGSRVDQAEARLNERIQAAEARLGDDIGQRVADIDAYVGRVSAGLDESVAVLSDRFAGVDSRFGAVDSALAEVNRKFDEIDVDSLDELKDRVASAAGEVELVRIEVERFQKSMGDELDKTHLRLVDVETQLQEHHMDVDTAVQLERLEEVERAIIALDPGQFVRRDELAPGMVTMAPASDPLSAPEPFQPSVTADY